MTTGRWLARVGWVADPYLDGFVVPPQVLECRTGVEHGLACSQIRFGGCAGISEVVPVWHAEGQGTAARRH